MRRLAAAIEAFTRIWIYFGIRSRDPDAQADASILPMLEDPTLQATSYAGLIARIFHDFAARTDARAAGDKMAAFESVDLDQYARHIPNLRVIHLIRDGRDVCLSWTKLWFGPTSVAEAAWLWKRHVLSTRRWGAAHPGSYIEVRYEDFVQEPHREMDRVGSFLGLAPLVIDEKAPSRLGALLSPETSHVKVGERIDRRNVEKWKTGMMPRQQLLFEWIAGATLAACGYAPSSRPPDASDQLRIAVMLPFFICRRYVSSNLVLRRMRAFAPVLLRAAQFLGFDLRSLTARLLRGG